MLGLSETKKSIPNAPVYLHPDDGVWYDSLSEQAKRFGISISDQPEKWDVDLKEGDLMKLGELRFNVMHTPGHAPGHVCFLEKEESILLVGDLLFRGSMYVRFTSLSLSLSLLSSFFFSYHITYAYTHTQQRSYGSTLL